MSIIVVCVFTWSLSLGCYTFSALLYEPRCSIVQTYYVVPASHVPHRAASQSPWQW